MKQAHPRSAGVAPVSHLQAARLIIVSALGVALVAGSAPAQGPDPARDRRPRPDRERNEQGSDGRPKGGQRYSIEQAVSDRGQLHTIAFNCVAFLSGDFGASTFIPPGKVCDYFGFQYMRDIDAAEKGHNPMFLNRVAGNVLHILNDEQRQLLSDLAEEQAPQLEELARMRLPLIKAFHIERDREKQGLDKEAVDVRRAFSTELRKLLAGETPERRKLLVLGRRYGELDGEMSWLYAVAFARVNRTLGDGQRTELVKLRNLPGYQSAPYYIYSRGREDQPKLGDVEARFFK